MAIEGLEEAMAPFVAQINMQTGAAVLESFMAAARNANDICQNTELGAPEATIAAEIRDTCLRRVQRMLAKQTAAAEAAIE